MKKWTCLVLVVSFFASVSMFVAGCSDSSNREAEKGATKAFLDGDWLQTVKLANQWASEDYGNPLPHALLNVAYTELNDHDGTMAELKIAYGSSDRKKKVQDWASALADAHNANPRANLLKGLTLEIAGDNQAAISAYRRAMVVDPSYRQGFASLGNLYLSNGQLDEALAVYNELLSKNPALASAYGHIATVYVMKDDMRQAVWYFEKAVELDPKDVVGQYNLASAYLQTKENGKAVLVLRRVAELDPTGEVGQNAKEKLAQLSK